MLDKLTADSIIMSLDVEAMGLYGTPFSYGYKLAELNGKLLEEKYVFSKQSLDTALDIIANWPSSTEATNYQWVKNNVLTVAGEPNTHNYKLIHILFRNDYLRLKHLYPELVLLADSPFPVETSLIYDALLATPTSINLMDISPYPILDLTSMRLAHNLSPYFDRQDDELPVHHPLMDARQTFRGLKQLLGY